MTPAVSVIFTSFNHREYLRQALDSLLVQTFHDFELIVVDDCSTDGSQEILKEYAARDNRIRLFLNERNSGSYVHSTNQGARYARTPYVVFAQCDDYAEPTQLECLVHILDTYPDVGVVFSASRMIDKDGILLREDYDVREKAFRTQCVTDTRVDKRLMERYFLCSCVIPNLSAAMVRRELFEKQGGFSDHYFVLADWDFWLKTTKECNFYYLRQPLNNFRQHPTTIRTSIKIKRQVEEVFRMYYDFFRLSGMGFGHSWRWKNRVARIWIDYIWQGKKIWFRTLFPLLKVSMKYDFYFPLIFAMQATRFFFVWVGYKMRVAR